MERLLIPSLIFAVCCCLLFLLRVLRKKHDIPNQSTMNVRVPISLFILITAVYIVFKNLHYPWVAFPLIEHVYSVLAVTCLGWLTIKIVNFGTLLFLSHFDLKKADNYRARKVHTQVRIFNHILVAFIIFLTILGILVSFKTVRDAGTSILASAGLVSILIGLAAQKTMSNFFAGIQIATAQPIRVDDVVVVENEWGRIEEIHLTFVVVKLWDLRRLIVPITYFTDHIFQNWTQKTADILGAVMLYVDYTMPVKLIREELDKLLEGNELWDGRVKVVQVSNANEQAMEIRILTSSPNSGTSFDLRCAIREHMINFIQKNYPDSLPRIRTEISKEPKFKIEHEPQDVAKEPVRAPAPTLDPHPKPMDPEGAH